MEGREKHEESTRIPCSIPFIEESKLQSFVSFVMELGL
jgi:hypothetical protein